MAQDPGNKNGDVYTANTPYEGDSNSGYADINGKNPGHQVQRDDDNNVRISRGGREQEGEGEQRDGWHITRQDYEKGDPRRHQW